MNNSNINNVRESSMNKNSTTKSMRQAFATEKRDSSGTSITALKTTCDACRASAQLHYIMSYCVILYYVIVCDIL